MKKFRIFKALFAASALALALPSCSDLSTNETSSLVSEEGKVAVSFSVSEGYRSIISSLPEDLTYSLEISSEGAVVVAKDNIALSSIPAVYLDAGKAYSFTINGKKGETLVLSGTTTKEISANDANVSITLNAVTGAEVSVELQVKVTSGKYGLSTVKATVYSDANCTTATEEALVAEVAKDSEGAVIADTYTLSGKVKSGESKWLKIELLNANNDVIGSKTEVLYTIAESDISATTNVAIKKYRANLKLTADKKPTTLVLKNSSVTNLKYTGIDLTAKISENAPYTVSELIPVGSYGVYADGSADSCGTVADADEVSVNTAAVLKSIVAKWTAESQPTLYAGLPEAYLLRNITIVETYSDASTKTVDSPEATVTGYNADSTESQTVKLTYNGKEAEITVQLTALALESIAINKSPSFKTEYTVGDELDLTGLVLSLTYNDTSKNTTVAYSADNATDFGATGFDSTSPAESQTVTITYGEKTATFKVTIKAQVLTVYTLSSDSATISLGKSQVGKIGDGDEVNNEINQYLSVATDYWSSEQEIGDFGKDTYYNMSNSSRTVTVKVAGVAGFDLYVKNGTAKRTFTVKIGDGTTETITHPGSKIINEVSTDIIPFTFNTGSTDELTITLGGTGNSVYPIYMVLYSTEQTIPVESVNITGAPEANVLLASGSVQLAATVSPDRATAKTITWTSSDVEIATVDFTGLVTYKAAGTVTITATAESGVRDEASITIQEANTAVTGVTLDKETASINKGGTVTLTATVAPENASNQNVTWSSSATDVATVSEGVVTGVKAGTATITVTTEDGSYSATCTVTVNAAYVKAGSYNLSTKAVTGYSVDNSTSGTWTAQDAGKSQTHDNITITAKVDSSGANLKKSDSNAGSITFDLESSLTMTFTDSNSKGITITPSTGASVTYDVTENSATTSVTKTGEISAKLGADGKETTVTLTAGSYVIYGATTSSSKIKTLKFTAVSE